ncbi:hypothetical protein [Aquabacterium sp.]|uniref:hypothetical protein n=1 Tax=Aquabacterium sp. TaxID=1872578 RepID=UPI0035AF0F9C
MSGHHEAYVINILDGMAARGIKPIVATDINLATSNSVKRIRCAHPSVHFIFSKPPDEISLYGSAYKDARREFAYWRWFKQTYEHSLESISVNRVLLPYIDYALYAIGMLGSPFRHCEFSGIAMRPTFHHREEGVHTPYRRSDFIKEALFGRLLKCPNLRHLLTIDDTLFRFAQKKGAAQWSKVKLIHDPTTIDSVEYKPPYLVSELATRTIPVLLVYGAIEARKGIKELLDAALVLHNTSECPTIVIAGRQGDEAAKIINDDKYISLKLSKKLIELNEFISSDLESQLLMNCDAVWMGYKAHYGMSGVIIKAAAAKRQIIATKDGLIGWHAAHLHRSSLVDVNDIGAICLSLRAITMHPFSNFDQDLLFKYSWENANNLILGH